MKKINKLTIIMSILSVSLLGACKKSYLDLKPYTDIPAGDAVNTPATIASALNGAYLDITSTNIYGRTLPVFGDLLADNAFVSAANSGRYISEMNYTVTVSDADVAGIWTTSYNTILRVNNIINSPLAGVDQIKGEAYALRALMYFNLVRYYAKPYTEDPNALGVPLVLTYDPSLLPARATVGAVYTQMLSDLDKAYSLMNTYRGSSYFSKYAARALAAKINLYKADYTTAYTDATDVINNSGFSLVTKGNFVAYFASQDPTNDASSQVETLFESVSTSTVNNSNDELTAIYEQGPTYGDILATKTLYDLYSSTDVRKAEITVGVRAKTGGENPAYLVNKYSDAAGLYGTKKIMRMAEVYLIAAEASARLGKTDALTLLNTLMAQRDPGLVYASTGAQLITDIITERRKELAFEGDRFNDLNRLKLAIPRTAEYPTGVIPYPSNKRVLPIPQTELNVNPNITQNPL